VRLATSVIRRVNFFQPQERRELPYFTTIYTMSANVQDAEALVHSDDPNHPANHICTLCAKFYNLGWVRHALLDYIDTI
jgi:hypothetical protein